MVERYAASGGRVRRLGSHDAFDASKRGDALERIRAKSIQPNKTATRKERERSKSVSGMPKRGEVSSVMGGGPADALGGTMQVALSVRRSRGGLRPCAF